MKAIALILAFLPTLAAAEALPKLKIEPESITVSGVSSGAFMAVQLQVALSARIRGTASVAGGIYWCAEGDRNKSQMQCMIAPGNIDPARHIQKAKDEAAKGTIDSLDNLSKTKVYLFQSKSDLIIRPESLDKLQKFFAEFVPDTRMRVRIDERAAHGFPTASFGNPCSQMGLPWMLNCSLDLAGEILAEFYGTLAPAKDPDSGNLVAFDQTLYAEKSAGLLAEGHAYIPKACREGESCRLHIALHGCQMNPDFIGDAFRAHAGFNGWAEQNRIVVLYPAAAKSAENPFACWDWFGYTGQDYVLKSGRQILAIQKMIDAIAGVNSNGHH